jgi:hypothetical protein
MFARIMAEGGRERECIVLHWAISSDERGEFSRTSLEIV